MKYFCNSKLEALKALEKHVGKNLSIGGIISDVQHRVAKNGKGWASFVLEGYDESHEFRIYGEEYLKFRHFLVPNNFTYMKLMVREGWVNQEGKRGDPRVQFIAIQYLQDVLTTFAKKLVLQFNVKDLSEQLIFELQQLFNNNRGDHAVTFEVMELQKVIRQVEVDASVANDDLEGGEEQEATTGTIVTNVEDVQVSTKLSMPSRKLKVNISNELLYELERLQVTFKLN